MENGLWLGKDRSSPNREKAVQLSQGLQLVRRQWESEKGPYSGHVLEEELKVLTDGWRYDGTTKKKGVRVPVSATGRPPGGQTTPAPQAPTSLQDTW